MKANIFTDTYIVCMYNRHDLNHLVKHDKYLFQDFNKVYNLLRVCLRLCVCGYVKCVDSKDYVNGNNKNRHEAYTHF